jgi:hypothetical protein
MTRWTGYLTTVLVAAMLIGCGGKGDESPEKVTLSPAELQEVQEGLAIMRLALEDGRLAVAQIELDALQGRRDLLPDDLKKELTILEAAYANAHGQEDVPEELPELPPAE